jgi:hypothetical protein
MWAKTDPATVDAIRAAVGDEWVTVARLCRQLRIGDEMCVRYRLGLMVDAGEVVAERRRNGSRVAWHYRRADAPPARYTPKQLLERAKYLERGVHYGGMEIETWALRRLAQLEEEQG